MHRHGYKGRKFGRETDERKALLRGLMCSLIEHKSINTTLAKAKEIRRPAEKLITLAKKGDLASRRLVIARLGSQELGSLLVDEIAPKVTRNSGYLRIERTGFRVGDHAEMATISFVDSLTAAEKPVAAPVIASKAKQSRKTEEPAEKPASKKETK